MRGRRSRRIVEDGSSFRADLEESTSKERPFMKFVSLKTQRNHRRGKLNKPSRATTSEPSAKPTAISHQIPTYTQRRQKTHDDLRVKHPEWVQPDGKSPMCDSYEPRLVKLLATQPIVDPHRLLEQGAN